MSFTLEETYGCTKEEYIRVTGMDVDSKIHSLEQEIKVLDQNYKRIQKEFRESVEESTGMMYEIELMNFIATKIKRKSDKIKELKRLMFD
jgi:predicted RNase H-like nuclease (RuvC/YqgF family)